MKMNFKLLDVETSARVEALNRRQVNTLHAMLSCVVTSDDARILRDRLEETCSEINAIVVGNRVVG